MKLKIINANEEEVDFKELKKDEMPDVIRQAKALVEDLEGALGR